MPITTRQLESLVRLAQARARAEMREIVSERDAREVVALLRAARTDELMTETGEIDGERASGMSKTKQLNAFIKRLLRIGDARESAVFEYAELAAIFDELGMDPGMPCGQFVELLRDHNYLLGRAGRYIVQSSKYSSHAMSQLSNRR